MERQFHPDPARKLSAAFYTVHTALHCTHNNGICHTGFADSLRVGSGWNWRSVLMLLASCQQNLYDIYHCCVCSVELLTMDRGTVRNM